MSIWERLFGRTGRTPGARQQVAGKANAHPEELLRELGSADPAARKRAALELGKSNDPGVVEPLIAALDDADTEVHLAALRALSTLILDLKRRQDLARRGARPPVSAQELSILKRARHAVQGRDHEPMRTGFVPGEVRRNPRPGQSNASTEERQGASLTAGKRLTGQRGKVSNDASKAGRAGKCRDCGAVIELTNAKEACLDWDGVDAYHFYCPRCFKGTKDPHYYTGQLLGDNGEAVIDQHCWNYEI